MRVLSISLLCLSVLACGDPVAEPEAVDYQALLEGDWVSINEFTGVNGAGQPHTAPVRMSIGQITNPHDLRGNCTWGAAVSNCSLSGTLAGRDVSFRIGHATHGWVVLTGEVDADSVLRVVIEGRWTVNEFDASPSLVEFPYGTSTAFHPGI